IHWAGSRRVSTRRSATGPRGGTPDSAGRPTWSRPGAGVAIVPAWIERVVIAEVVANVCSLAIQAGGAHEARAGVCGASWANSPHVPAAGSGRTAWAHNPSGATAGGHGTVGANGHGAMVLGKSRAAGTRGSAEAAAAGHRSIRSNSGCTVS